MSSGDALQPPSPAGSQLSSIRRSPSHESLTAHPLLVPGSSSLNASNAPPDSARTTSPKYKPYTPRQRVPTGSVTTGTTVSSPISVSPQQRLGDATSKLQIQNLKAVAQNNGLDAASLGWAMLEDVVLGSDQGLAWSEIWSAITAGKAMLLLPREHASSHEAIHPEFLRDHVIFCNGTTRNDSPFVTLSGMRGIINEKVSFRSTLPVSSKAFKAILSPSTRSSSLLALPPLPELSAYAPSYPEFHISATVPSLPFPPRSLFQQKPPLPPRPGTRPQPSSTSSRIISNPFASFFSKSSTPSSPSLAPTTDIPQLDHGVEVPAFVIDRPIVRRTVSKGLTKAIKSEIKDSLSGLPSWIADRTQHFSANLLPFPLAPKFSRDSSLQDGAIPPYSVSALEEAPEDIEESFQNFYDVLEQELRASDSPSTLRRRDERSHAEDKEGEKKVAEGKIRDTLERVERVLCCTFYDRLFRQPNSDDASHDEALSSRIAALNMLDLTLDHLGVDIGASAKADIDGVITACGETISQLEVATCPADKSAILVASHRIIVDGLSRLPPVRLKSDDTYEDDKTPMATQFEDKVQISSSTSTVKPSSPPHDSNAPSSIATGSDAPRIDGDEQGQGTANMSELDLPSALSPVDPPLLTVSPPPKNSTPVSGDTLLPLLIFAVVKANPPQLVSHLLFTQRFRNRSFGGEESYCLVNLMAVVEFLENVDLGALGLKESESKVLSTADLTPIPIAQTALVSEKSSLHAGLRGRVEQQVDAIAGSANKVLSGVVDSGFGVLRALLPTHSDAAGEGASAPSDGEVSGAPWNAGRPGFGLLRRQSGFSIASIAASLPGRERSKSLVSTHQKAEYEDGQEMVESRPSSVRSLRIGGPSDAHEDASSSSDRGNDSEDGESEGDDEDVPHDTRSIRSFESMMSGKGGANRKGGRASEKDKKERMSLTDRLAHMSRLTRGSASSQVQPLEIPVHHGSPPPRSSSLHPYGSSHNRMESPLSSRSQSPITDRPFPSLRLAPPNLRFLDCSPDDLKMSEIPLLLAEYRRLVGGIREAGGFEDK